MYKRLLLSIWSLHAPIESYVGWLRRWAAEATTEPLSLWRLITLNSWTLTPEWASSHHPSFLQMNQSTIVFMALCLLAAINAGLFNHRIQSHHNNVHKVIIPSTQPTALPQHFHWIYSRGPAMNCGEASDLTATSTTLLRNNPGAGQWNWSDLRKEGFLYYYLRNRFAKQNKTNKTKQYNAGWTFNL